MNQPRGTLTAEIFVHNIIELFWYWGAVPLVAVQPRTLKDACPGEYEVISLEARSFGAAIRVGQSEPMENKANPELLLLTENFILLLRRRYTNITNLHYEGLIKTDSY